ncbi:MAG TPA: tetratricopeptide repeat protein, partial [Rhodanobacteraceae bacterium]|nr:tetratricopeptide repeat protein [Rhodanobacteraceae bacterium]
MNAEGDLSTPSPSIYQFGRGELDEQRHEVRVDGHAVALEAKPYALLRVLLGHPGETLSKDELIDAVWTGRVVTEGVLAKSVTKLRSALGDDAQTVIRTVHGYGYRLAVAVTVRQAPDVGSTPLPRADEAVPLRPNWRLAQELGSGGYGHVWLAEHAKTREQRVFKFAIDAAGLKGLKREIMLFRLLHDSFGNDAAIVRILDWNVDEPPYFLESEYIAGGNLIVWCESHGGANRLPRALRIELIAAIADAFAAAHSLGVLHKDLKPANVLIEDGGEGPRARLTDFGSGRALEPERLTALGITRLGLTQTQSAGETTSGTPYYLAPELIAGGAPTVRADIYALGVMLYQILVGDFRRPLAPGWERDIDDELLREDIALAADVDVERRLGDASELARRLRDLPRRAAQRAAARAARIRATEQGAQLARWRMRRRWLIALCATFALASMVGVGLYLRAEREAGIARAVNEFLNRDLLAAANPYGGVATDLRVREVLDRARDRVAARFAARPAEERAIRETLGNAYLGIGDHAEARRQLARALELAVAQDGPRGEGVLALRRTLADNDVEDSHYEDAERTYAALAADIVARDGADSAAALDLAAARAHLLLRERKEEQAATTLEALIPRLQRAFGRDGEVTLAARTDLGQAYQKMARFDDAEKNFRAVYQARTRRFGKGHWSALQSLQDLALLERAQGHADRAITLERDVVHGREKAFDRSHEETQNALNELAGMLQDRKDYAAAEPLFREVLATREKTLGERHERTRNSMNNLALLLSK